MWEEYGDNQAKLVVHTGGFKTTREELKGIPLKRINPEYTPVDHYELVQCIAEEASHRGIAITREELAYHPTKDMLVGVMVLNWANTQEFATALAFRHANNGSEAVKLYAGVRVFACDNTSVSGNEILLCKKHTRHLDIGQHMPNAFDRYQDGALMLTQSIEELQGTQVDQKEGRQVIYDVFRKRIVPVRYFRPVTDMWEGMPEGNMWTLHNCFTASVKFMKPQPFMTAQHRLGKYFKLGKSPQNGLGQEIIPDETQGMGEAIEAEFEAIVE